MADKLARLKELAHIVAKGPDVMRREFTMRVPAEPDRDADLVIMWAATEIAALRAENAELRNDAERYRWLRQRDWFDSNLCVLRDPKEKLTNGVGLGADCPSHGRLDAAIDAEIGRTK